MRIKIEEANLGPYRYRYEIRGIVHGNKVFYGASKILEFAEKTAMRQAYEIFDNPWENPNDKLKILSNISIIDQETGKDVTAPEVLDYIDSLMSELDSRSKFKKESIQANSLDNIVTKITVNAPNYRGARVPQYNPLQINETKFDDTLRFKSYEITSDGNTINVEWISQEAPEDEVKALNKFYKEIVRAIKANLKKNNYKEPVEVNIHISDRYDTFDESYQIFLD